MSGGKISMDELAAEFGEAPSEKKVKKSASKKTAGSDKSLAKNSKYTKKTKPKKWAIAVFTLGMLALIGGGAFLAVKLLASPKTADVEFLVSAGEWVEKDAPSVIWNFTEVGKGSLTTDDHLNDYNFIWALDGETLKIETNWLYNLNNEFTYALDQSAKTLTIKNDEAEIVFEAKE